MSDPMKVSASILAAPLAGLGESVRSLDPACVDLIHMDIMDGNFVPQITFGEGICQAVADCTQIPLDVHLMVAHPEREVPKYFPIKPYNITFHYEASNAPIRLAQEIRKHGILAGISINPSTPVHVLKDILSFFDLVLLMGVEPGFAGQAFLTPCFSRVEELVQLRRTHHPSLLIEVDGGVDGGNAVKLKKLGADIIVSGSFIFKSKQPSQKALSLKCDDPKK